MYLLFEFFEITEISRSLALLEKNFFRTSAFSNSVLTDSPVQTLLSILSFLFIILKFYSFTKK